MVQRSHNATSIQPLPRGREPLRMSAVKREQIVGLCACYYFTIGLLLEVWIMVWILET